MSINEDRFKAMVENSQDWFWEFDENANFTYSSPRIRDLLGYEPEEIVGLNAFDLMDAEEAERVHHHFDPIAKKYLPFNNLININVHKDGHEVVIESSGTPIFDETGRFRGYRGIDRDITDRKLTEDLLQERTSKLKDIIATSTEWIWEMEVDGHHTYSNKALGAILGYALEEFVGREFSEFLHEDDLAEVAAVLPRHIAEKSGWRGWVLRWKHKDGSYRFLESNATPVLDAAGEVVGFRGADRDVTQRMFYEQELENARNAAESNNRAKDEFLANMSHELRTPITGILGFSELLKRTALDEKQRNYLGMIASSTEILRALVNDLLDIAKIEAGKMSLECEEFSLRKLLDDIVSGQYPVAKGKGLTLESQIQGIVPDQLKGDPLRLKQILLNLVVNAVKFTERGGVSLSVIIEETLPSAVMLRFEVADTGVGINRTDLDKIFHPFSQVDSSSSRKFGGAGLGLAICSSLTTMMDGELSVESREGGGSTFYVRLPFETGVLENGAVDSPVKNRSVGPDEVAVRILLVDDHKVSQKFFAELLQLYGHQVDLAENGAEALTKMQEHAYDLVLMDLQMPTMDGLEAVSKIRALEQTTGHHVPIIALTAHAMERNRAEALTKGFDGYATKPLKIDELFAEIKRCLGQRMAQTV